MTKRLILTRHAKSSWDDPLLSDKQRPLNGRGRHSATAIGNWLRAQGYIPDQTLSSSSARTRETCALLGFDDDQTFLDALYHAGPNAMLGALRRATGDAVLMLGHNPGIADFAEMMVARAPDHIRFFDYPTCATLVADFAIDNWHDLQPGTGQPVAFMIPRELG